MDMATMTSTHIIMSHRKGSQNECGCSRLWPVVTGDYQLVILYPVRLQFFQAALKPRLAHVRPLLGFYRGVVHRDVRLPADDLLSLRLADGNIPGRELAVA